MPAERQPTTERMNNPLPSGNDPGGAHAKGYSADPRSEKPTPENGPLPVSQAMAGPEAIRQPELQDGVQPTGRSEPGDEYTDRVIDSGE